MLRLKAHHGGFPFGIVEFVRGCMVRLQIGAGAFSGFDVCLGVRRTYKREFFFPSCRMVGDALVDETTYQLPDQTFHQVRNETHLRLSSFQYPTHLGRHGICMDQ